MAAPRETLRVDLRGRMVVAGAVVALSIACSNSGQTARTAVSGSTPPSSGPSLTWPLDRAPSTSGQGLELVVALKRQTDPLYLDSVAQDLGDRTKLFVTFDRFSQTLAIVASNDAETELLHVVADEYRARPDVETVELKSIRL